MTLILTLAILAGQTVKLPVGLGGVTILDAVITILSIYLLIQLKFRLKIPPLFISAALIFIFIAITSLLLTPLRLQFSEMVVSFLYIVRFSLYILFAYLIYLTKINRGTISLRKIKINLKYGGIGLAILGLLQFIFLPDLSFLTKWGWDPHFFRTVSTFLDPNFTGAFFVLTLILMSQNLAIVNKKKVIFFVLVYLALLTTFSRSSYLMFLVSGLTLSFLQKSKKIMLIVIILFIILLTGFKLYSQIISSPRNIDREQSASSRLDTWQQGAKLVQNHPLLGVGFNAYRYALKEYKLGDEQFLNSHGASSNDSSLLFVAATTGIIGLFSYLLFLFLLIKHVWGENVILISALLGLLIHSIFANSLFYPPILLWLLVMAATPKK